MSVQLNNTFAGAILALSTLITAPVWSANAAPSPSPALATIGVMAHSDFLPDRVQPQKGKQIGLPDLLADRIIQHLSSSRRFIPVDRTALRRVILEQRFGREIQKGYLDRTLDKAIDSLPDAVDSENGYGGSAAIVTSGAAPPGRIESGTGAVGTTGALADFNDLIKDYQDLGSAVGADFLVLGALKKLSRTTQSKSIPFSDSGRKVRKNLVDARLRLRIIDTKSGKIAGATSI
jgi:curli biogenesis system outer membrane secretion channel CsgG